MFETDGDSQTAFGLLSTSIPSEVLRPSVPKDPWAQLNQVEGSISRIERLPQSFSRIAHLFYSGATLEGQKLLRHCLETLSQLFGQWPLSAGATETDGVGFLEFAATVKRRNECLELIREVCRYREAGDVESMAHCIEDELIMKLKSLDVSLRILANKLSSENN